MGRPEKSESRELSPAVHTLFPIGEAGGSQRDVSKAAAAGDQVDGTRGEVEVQVGRRRCTDCGAETYHARCQECNGTTDAVYVCRDCDIEVEPDAAGRAECHRCESLASPVQTVTVSVREEFHDALEAVGERENAFDVLKGVKGLSSKEKTPEPIEKGIMRAKHGVSAFKDGTVRYDMTDLPVTSVRPGELDVTADQFRALGYEEDIHGDPLRHDDQLVELKVQDVVLSDGAAEHMLKTAAFVDDLLEKYYGLDPYYDLDDRQDLVGELVFGMAPHTSAATVGRIIGFTSAAVGYAHPYFHAAKRRNCFHPETKVWYEDEDGSWHHESIESLVERYLDPEVAESDDFGTLVDHLDTLDGTLHVPALADDGSQSARPVEALSKHPAPDHMVRVETESGRSLRLTPDHDVHVFDDDLGRIESVPAGQLDEADTLVKPAHLESVDPATDCRQFDLLAEYLSLDGIDDDRLMIKGLDKDRLYDLFERRLADEWDGRFYPLQSTAEHLGLTKKRLSNYLYRESIPVSLLRRFFDSDAALLEFVPSDVKLGMKRDSAEIDRTVTLTPRVATLLGYYAAEGFTRRQDTSKGDIYQTTICGTEPEAREFFLDVLADEFGVDPYEENHAKITVSGRLLHTLFDSVFDAGRLAHTKRVPQCIFDAPDAVVEAYLSGYFSGDGSTDSGAPRVTATTVSPELESDLVALLTRLGITATVREAEPRPLREQFPDFYEATDDSLSRPTYELTVSRGDAVAFADRVGFHLSRKDERLTERVAEVDVGTGPAYAFDGGHDDIVFDPVDEVSYEESYVKNVYCLTVSETHSLVAEDLSVAQCDGDEDCVMLLLDGLLNFSKSFLPDKRGGRMDAPLVMSSRIDPSEIDDEAHNMDIVDQYPVEFYEATREMADPEDVEDLITIAEENLGTDREYTDFRHTHDTSNIALGPDLSAYKTLDDMMKKMNAQLELARKLRAVDETDVAERVIEYHFLPDIIGNLRAFSRQEMRCLDCGEKYRRAPLTGHCRAETDTGGQCGGDLNLTVHHGSVNKYIETAITVAEEYGARPYTKQRLEILKTSIERVFENDKNKQSGISDFM